MAGRTTNPGKCLKRRDRQIEERICACPRSPSNERTGRGTKLRPTCHSGRQPPQVGRRGEAFLLADLDGENPPYVQVIEDVMKTVASGDEEQTAHTGGWDRTRSMVHETLGKGDVGRFPENHCCP